MVDLFLRESGGLLLRTDKGLSLESRGLLFEGQDRWSFNSRCLSWVACHKRTVKKGDLLVEVKWSGRKESSRVLVFQNVKIGGLSLDISC